MEGIGDFYGYFNLVLGTVMTLIGFKIYRPFAKEREEDTYRRFGNLFKYGGIVLMIGGLMKILY